MYKLIIYKKSCRDDIFYFVTTNENKILSLDEVSFKDLYKPKTFEEKVELINDTLSGLIFKPDEIIIVPNTTYDKNNGADDSLDMIKNSKYKDIKIMIINMDKKKEHHCKNIFNEMWLDDNNFSIDEVVEMRLFKLFLNNYDLQYIYGVFLKYKMNMLNDCMYEYKNRYNIYLGDIELNVLYTLLNEHNCNECIIKEKCKYIIDSLNSSLCDYTKSLIESNIESQYWEC